MTMSIVHRITGGALYFGTLLVAWWLFAAATSERYFDFVDWIFGSGMEFSGFVSASKGIVGRVSDHPFVYTQAYVPEEPLGGDQGDEPSGDPSPTDDNSDDGR